MKRRNSRSKPNAAGDLSGRIASMARKTPTISFWWTCDVMRNHSCMGALLQTADRKAPRALMRRSLTCSVSSRTCGWGGAYVSVRCGHGGGIDIGGWEGGVLVAPMCGACAESRDWCFARSLRCGPYLFALPPTPPPPSPPTPKFNRQLLDRVRIGGVLRPQGLVVVRAEREGPGALGLELAVLDEALAQSQLVDQVAVNLGRC